MTLIQKSLFAFVFCASMAAQAQSSGGLQAGRSDIFADIGVDVASASNVDPTSVSFGLGAKYAYFFKEKIGVFAGADYIDRKFSRNNETIKLSTIDIPFGIVFNYNGSLFADEAAIFLGLAYQIPVGFSDNLDLVDGKGALAFYLGTASYFNVTPGFLLGLAVDLKFGLTESLKATAGSNAASGRTTDILIGLGAKFE